MVTGKCVMIHFSRADLLIERSGGSWPWTCKRRSMTHMQIVVQYSQVVALLCAINNATPTRPAD